MSFSDVGAVIMSTSVGAIAGLIIVLGGCCVMNFWNRDSREGSEATDQLRTKLIHDGEGGDEVDDDLECGISSSEEQIFFKRLLEILGDGKIRSRTELTKELGYSADVDMILARLENDGYLKKSDDGYLSLVGDLDEKSPNQLLEALGDGTTRCKNELAKGLDLLLYSPPCRGFSDANRQVGLEDIIDALKSCNASAITFEITDKGSC